MSAPNPFPARLVVASAVLAVCLSACNRDREPVEAPVPAAPGSAAAVTPADAAAPLTFQSKTPWANVSLTLPDTIKPQPDLHVRLYADEVRSLRQFTEGAQADRTEAGNDADLPVYEKEITVSTAAQTGKLLSLRRVDYDYSGGAHPNTLTTGILWDKALKRQIGLADLFRKNADLTALDQALCAAINTAKRARAPDSAALTLDGKEGSCPRARDTAFALVPGTMAGKAGGLSFLIGAYQVGPYAEGAYEIAVPVSVFRSLLVAAYADEFGGQLTRSGDVTPVNVPAATPA